ncbi:MAG: ATP-dependent DNA helicase RecG [Clostridiales bacterium]|jgi:ATP-dependent DNA helicase RecG|nr:ATP-dependent DNA helicase RecG [Clostridiales bacterium]
MQIEDPIQTLPGIGDKRRQSLNAAGIFSVRDMIEYFPRDYEDRSTVTPLPACMPGAVYTVRARIAGGFETRRVKALSITKVRAADEGGEIDLIWFNQPYLKTAFQPNRDYVFTGKVSERFGRLQMEAPDYEIADGRELTNAGRIVPIYVSVGRLSQKNLRALVKLALDGVAESLPDFLPEEIKAENGLCDRDFAVRNIHFPADQQAFFLARTRLVFDELLIAQLTLYLIKGEVKKEKGVAVAESDLGALLSKMPFAMTAAQRRVLREISADLSGGFIMNRLVQGDVGSGKTAVAMAAAYAAVRMGYQAALMAPTEVLAGQHYQSFCEIFDGLDMKTVLLSGHLKKKEKAAVYDAIETGAAQIIIGTHALIQEGVRFHHLALAITDEQHRFGVRQRIALSEKSGKPNILVMSATPIPRTLALIIYGDLDISMIDELPPGRQKIETYGVGTSYRERIYAFLEKEMKKGRQIYVICPAIEESEQTDMKSVLKHTADIAARFRAYAVACLHGKMKPAEKQDVLARFSAGQTHILVATTVIEVGINVPNATVMLVENAERFGLSQLHQLRGRVGRGSEKSYCILMTDSQSKVTKERVKAMAATGDGFKISEMDLKLRGPGDYFGTRQHGLPEFKIANLYKDMAVLKAAQAAAGQITQSRAFEKSGKFDALYQEICKKIRDHEKISL